MRRLRSVAPVLLLPFLLAPASAWAQARSDSPGLEVEAASLAGNALLGGLTAGFVRMARGGSFADAFRTGAAGGVATYAGKRLSVEEFWGAGLIGRQVAAVGTSVTRNAGEGRPALGHVMLPLGPVRLYAEPRSAVPIRARVDAANLVATVATAFQGDTRFDWGASLSSGAPVFRREGAGLDVGWDGAHVAGVVLVRDLLPGEAGGEFVPRGTVLAHERVHVVQYDQTFLLLAEPLEGWLLERSGWGAAPHRWVDVGANVFLWGGLNAAIPYRARPWEAEADALSGSDRPEHGRRVF